MKVQKEWSEGAREWAPGWENRRYKCKWCEGAWPDRGWIGIAGPLTSLAGWRGVARVKVGRCLWQAGNTS